MPVQPDVNEQPEKIIFNLFDGLKNTVKRNRLGPHDLAKAVNIDIDDAGQIHRRRGFTNVWQGDAHSLFQATNGEIYGVLNNDLGRVFPDYSFVPMRMGIGGDYETGTPNLAYVQVGSRIYYSGPTLGGIIDTERSTVGDWGPTQDFWLSPVINPTANLPAIRGKLLGAPPRAISLAYYNGSIYLAHGRTVWFTEPFLYDLIDKTRNFYPFEDDVCWIGSVSDGVYVGTDGGVYFLSGDAMPLKRTKIMDSAAIRGSLVYLPQELANPPQVGLEAETETKVSVGFLTTMGFCVGSEGGRATNMTESRVIFPGIKRASAMFRRQDGFNQYVFVGDSEGQPTNSAALGDFVDARIIRGRDKWAPMQEGFKVWDQFSAEVV